MKYRLTILLVFTSTLVVFFIRFISANNPIAPESMMNSPSSSVETNGSVYLPSGLAGSNVITGPSQTDSSGDKKISSSTKIPDMNLDFPKSSINSHLEPTDAHINDNVHIVKVYFATDRKQQGLHMSTVTLTGDRGEVVYGQCEVSIPRVHRMGIIETPSIFRLEFSEDPERHFIASQLISMDLNVFLTFLNNAVSDFDDKKAFIFIHGYNVSFVDAAKRTAQIAFDLGFKGAPIFFSWPSQGLSHAYPVDEQNVEWAIPDFVNFLNDLFTKTDIQDFYLIAHSMGNRLLTRGLTLVLQQHPEQKKRIKEVVLTAPDIDADVFKREIAPALTSKISPITLYASSKDLALLASKKIHGYPRAGDSGASLLIVHGVETIDATNVETDFLGHSYFARNKSVLSDIFSLIRDNKRPDARFGIRAILDGRGKHWEFVQ